MLNHDIYHKARLSRDSRFDGKFFTAVKTTRIYCRPICPATTPREENVTYFLTAIEAANAGYRPCLRCRPDSAPGSSAWKGVNTTLERAMTLINQGALQENSLPMLATRLGISDRYLRQLFQKHLGVSPKSFALHQQCLFAKQLLHQTRLPITEIALASGFNSVRRFNDCFQSQLKLTPSQVRRSAQTQSNNLALKLYYRPPYNWSYIRQFFKARAIPAMEWVGEHHYGRTFSWAKSTGRFTASHNSDKNRFDVTLTLDDLSALKPVVQNIRRILDLDVDIEAVTHNLSHHFGSAMPLETGIRLPGIWSLFEAGIRAILGQQISVVAAHQLVTDLTHELGQTSGDEKVFPTPESIVKSDLGFLRIPASRKQTLHNLATHYVEDAAPDAPEQWLTLKGIGRWTVDYARLRGLSEPDIYLGGDLGVRKASGNSNTPFDPLQASPWRSYLTLQLWSQL